MGSTEQMDSTKQNVRAQSPAQAPALQEAPDAVRAWCEAVDAAAVELNRAKDDLVRARRVLGATEKEAAETAARTALLLGRPSRAMLTWAGVIGAMAGVSAFLVLLALLTVTHVLSGG